MAEALNVTQTGVQWESMYRSGKAEEIGMTAHGKEIQQKLNEGMSERRPDNLKFDSSFDEPNTPLPPPEKVTWMQKLWNELDVLDNTIEVRY